MEFKMRNCLGAALVALVFAVFPARVAALEVILEDGSYFHFEKPTGWAFNGERYVHWRMVGLPEKIVFVDRDFTKTQEYNHDWHALDLESMRGYPRAVGASYPFQPIGPIYIEWAETARPLDPITEWKRTVTVYRRQAVWEPVDQGFGRRAAARHEVVTPVDTINTEKPVRFLAGSTGLAFNTEGYASSFDLTKALDGYLMRRGLTLRLTRPEDSINNNYLITCVGRVEPTTRDIAVSSSADAQGRIVIGVRYTSQRPEKVEGLSIHQGFHRDRLFYGPGRVDEQLIEKLSSFPDAGQPFARRDPYEYIVDASDRILETDESNNRYAR